MNIAPASNDPFLTIAAKPPPEKVRFTRADTQKSVVTRIEL
jgi:hypothetical protein